MSIEFSAVCPESPPVVVVARMTEILLGVVLDTDVSLALVTDEWGVELKFGSVARTLLTSTPPGQHEFADAYVLTADDRDRTPESRLLAVVVVLACAIATRGWILDENGWLRSSDLRVLASLLVQNSSHDANDVLNSIMTLEQH